ncbi:hypothetical protein RIF29_36251 [Crotalaria pallida]|uniref:Uncharacterized protein n=1 Tax=Crotalaria pallida TaxID=3830 RepID=A0AAN9ED47_CROPI
MYMKIGHHLRVRSRNFWHADSSDDVKYKETQWEREKVDGDVTVSQNNEIGFVLVTKEVPHTIQTQTRTEKRVPNNTRLHHHHHLRSESLFSFLLLLFLPASPIRISVSGFGSRPVFSLLRFPPFPILDPIH